MTMSLIEKIDKLDRRYIFLMLAILCFLPVMLPMGLPVPLSSATISSYKTMENLKAGDILCMTFDYSGGSAAELYPQNVVILKHALKKGLRAVAVSFSVGGLEMANMAFEESGYTKSKVYGVDYVNLGFVAGGETGMSSFAKDIHGLIKTDARGTPLDQIPLMNDVQNLKSFAYFAFTTSTSQDMYVRQFSSQGVPVVGCIQSLYFSILEVYMSSGQIVGFINGLRGSAEYEIMTGYLGVGAITMDQASITHLYGVILLIIGNIAFYFSRKKKGGK
jgi:hypothetical protein